MKQATIYNDVSEAVKSLLNIARDSSFNNISDNCSYIISEIKHSDKNFFDQTKIRKAANDKKVPKSFSDLITDLEKLYPNLYDVNLYVYKADKDSTLIEIQYFSRSYQDADYQNGSATQETMLHCKVALPPYARETKEKFDINWEHGTVHHKWNMFWWRQKAKRCLRKNSRE